MTSSMNFFLSFGVGAAASVFAGAFGFFSGAFISTLPSVAADRFGTENLPSVLGVLYVGSALGNLLSGPMVGIMYDAQGTYLGGQLLSCGTLAAGMVCFFFVASEKTAGEPGLDAVDLLGDDEEQDLH